MSEETRDVANKQGGALATLDFVADSGMGLENIDKGDLALPFLKLLQSMLTEQKQGCFIIQLQKNCMLETKVFK